MSHIQNITRLEFYFITLLQMPYIMFANTNSTLVDTAPLPWLVGCDMTFSSFLSLSPFTVVSFVLKDANVGREVREGSNL